MTRKNGMPEWPTARGGLLPALVFAMLAGSAVPVSGQVPSPIPSNQESQILNLLQRVTALEAKVAAFTSGTMKAPVKVVDAGGNPILQVVDGQASSVSRGLVIVGDAASGTGGLVVYNKAGKNAVLLATNGEAGGLGLADAQGKVRTSLNGAGRIVVSDENENSFLTIASDVSKDESEIRIGGSDAGYAVEVGSGNGVASLGVDEEGVPELSLTDGGNHERAAMSGDGTLQISDAAGKDILTVVEDVTGEKAGVAIGRKDNGGYLRVSDAAGNPAAGSNGSNRTVAVADAGGKTAAEMAANGASGLVRVMGSDGAVAAVMTRAPDRPGGVFEVHSKAGAVGFLSVGPAGAGMIQLTNESGTPVILAGTLAGSGRGVVMAGPQYVCEEPGATAIVKVGRRPDCIVGKKN